LIEFQAGILSATTYSWLTELCTHKTDQLPNLHAISINEALKLYGIPPVPGISWHPPHDTISLDQYGIDLSVQLRKQYLERINALYAEKSARKGQILLGNAAMERMAI
jgi:hypothetical protein